MSGVKKAVTKRISSKVDLPDWFQLRSYLGHESKSPRWWRYELATRAHAEFNGRLKATYSDDEIAEEIPEYIFHEVPADSRAGARLNTPLRPLKVRTVQLLASAVKDIKYPEALGDVNTGRAHYLEVDLSISDEVLVREFKSFLQERRGKGVAPQMTRPVTDRKKEKLSEYRVLALLDLLRWERENNVKIKRSVLASALFPDGEKGERELTDSIIPFAWQAITPQFLTELSSLEDRPQVEPIFVEF